MFNHIDAICPFCKVHVSFSWTEPSERGGKQNYYLHSYYSNMLGIWAIAVCPSCHNCVLLKGEPNGQSFNVKNIYPASQPSPTDERMPADIRRDIEESKLALSVGAFNASAAMSRRALQRACKTKGSKKSDLIDQINELADNKIITTDIKELAHTVRLVGNDGAHPNEVNVDASDAKEILELAEQFMEIIFIAPAKVREIKEKRERKNGNDTLLKQKSV